jgi:hypothetical protein
MTLKTKMLALAAVAGTATAAYAQPTSTNLGDRSTSSLQTTTPFTLASVTDVQWYQIILPAANNTANNWVDIWTMPQGAAIAAGDVTDTEIGLYRPDGSLRASDDDDGPTYYSQLSFGYTTAHRAATAFPGLATGVAPAGQDGVLAAGTYYIGVVHYDATFTAGFTVTTDNTETTETSGNLIIAVQLPTAPLPPTVTAVASSTKVGLSGYATILTANVALGANPASAISSVTSNLTAIGGPASAAFHDDGLLGDATANDGIYSYATTVTAAPGSQTFTVTATDSLARSGNATGMVNIAQNLGDLSTAATSIDLTINNTNANDIKWFKMQLPAVDGLGSVGYVDIYCKPTSANPATDPIPANDSVDPDLALFDNAGTLITYDDLDGPGYWAMLTYGNTTVRSTPAYTGATAGGPLDGHDGALTGGTYWLATGHYQMVSSTGFNAASTYTGAERNTIVHVETLPNTAPTPPSLISAGATPAAGTSGTPVTINVTVNPGTNPTSGSVTVTANLTSLGGGAAVAMTDPESDGTYSVTTSIPAGASDFSSYSVQIDAVDNLSRNATPVSVVLHGQATALDEATLAGGDADQSLATAGTFSGTGAMNAIIGTTNNTTDLVDMYKIQICDEANFLATTNFSTGTPDTQLFLFDGTGMGVEMNDDDTGVGPSRIDSTFVTANGTYYLAVSRYNIDPMDSAGALLWHTGTPYTGIIAPDGPAAANPLDHFDATLANAISQGAYRISFQGVCFPAPAQCSPADMGRQGGEEGQDNRLDNNDFIIFINYFFAHDARADLGRQGGEHASDGAWDNNDFVAFIDYFFNDAALCNG